MPERLLLVHQPDAQEVYMDGRSELDKRRLAQETEVEAERGRKYKAKLTTRGDVMAIIELYNSHKILPLAARLDAAEGALQYLTAPWWKRRWWDAKIIGAKVYKWLESRRNPLVQFGRLGRRRGHASGGGEHPHFSDTSAS